ncbi:hypothetical protein E2C01_015786 [Portunus trituberculatus]|uniref:Uncharacterized protein n=1 Tax=Portunus trituberculatus TaxID=210409 RepID=A0A5B7DME0_PORTR|nr:hypothetical protein [Portunus trituberculatus]
MRCAKKERILDVGHVAALIVVLSFKVDISVHSEVRLVNGQKGSDQRGAELSISRGRPVSTDCSSVRGRTSQPVYSHFSPRAVLVNAYKFAPVLYHYGEAYFMATRRYCVLELGNGACSHQLQDICSPAAASQVSPSPRVFAQPLRSFLTPLLHPAIARRFPSMSVILLHSLLTPWLYLTVSCSSSSSSSSKCNQSTPLLPLLRRPCQRCWWCHRQQARQSLISSSVRFSANSTLLTTLRCKRNPTLLTHRYYFPLRTTTTSTMTTFPPITSSTHF